MIGRATRLRFRRRFRMRRRQVETMGSHAERRLDVLFFRRLHHLVRVRRFVAVWILLVVLLSGCVLAQTRALSNYYQTLKPAPGGNYNEGLIGEFTNANPIYATNVADRTVSRLLFSSLLTYNKEGKLVGDLASDWSSDDRGKVYTIHLKDNVTWHDGRPLTADDVVFTYSVIQNPDTKSPLNLSWQGITVKAENPRTVTFTLNSPLVSFPDSLTNGIVPKHILKNVAMPDMRSVAFNTSEPVGSGPFKWQTLQVTGEGETRQEHITLVAFDKYYQAAPKLATFTVHTFRSADKMIESFRDHEINAMLGLQSVPKDLSSHYLYSLPQSAEVMTFFKTSTGVLADKTVRHALIQAVDTGKVRSQLSYTVHSVTEPLLKGQLGYDPRFVQDAFNPEEAKKMLDAVGWMATKPGAIRQKDGQALEFRLVAENTDNAAKVTRSLQQQWREVGVNAKADLLDATSFQTALAQHSYDALLRGISLGSDPDVFVYWHSSQADIVTGSHLNFSEYKSGIADEALEAARSRTDPTIRAAKYQPFLQAWKDDAPALGLYQPSVLYITHQQIHGFENHSVNIASDRFFDVQDWMIRQVKTTVD